MFPILHAAGPRSVPRLARQPLRMCSRSQFLQADAAPVGSYPKARVGLRLRTEGCGPPATVQGQSVQAPFCRNALTRYGQGSSKSSLNFRSPRCSLARTLGDGERSAHYTDRLAALRRPDCPSSGSRGSTDENSAVAPIHGSMCALWLLRSGSFRVIMGTCHA